MHDSAVSRLDTLQDKHPSSLTGSDIAATIRIMQSNREGVPEVRGGTRRGRGQVASTTADHLGALLTSMTCAADGQNHWIRDGVHNAHRYPALCGRLVVPAALVAPPGPNCTACAAALNEGHQRRRSRSLSTLAWLVGSVAYRPGKHRRNRAPRSVNAS